MHWALHVLQVKYAIATEWSRLAFKNAIEMTNMETKRDRERKIRVINLAVFVEFESRMG